MTPRTTRHAQRRAPVTPIHRGPQAAPIGVPHVGPSAPPFHHAPNAALLIDFDNVTMGIRSDLGHELQNLLGSDIIKGKVAVQRAYADWRRYPQYVVRLAESSIDMIMATAYGSSKKNATDIRLAVDAMELVFTRPEIGTYILLSGDSDFSSLVLKLKEYGKYVIGVGIRESSSDLLVMNCDEYYSYNALAGLVKSSEEEVVKRDPWELVSEAIVRMKRNGDVMRSDRLKQVMQEIDSTFDEKNLGISKFSKFCLEAAQRGLLAVSRLENGQFEVDVPSGGVSAPRAVSAAAAPASTGARQTAQDRPARPQERSQERSQPAAAMEGGEPARSRRGRRGGRGRARARDESSRMERADTTAETLAADASHSPAAGSVVTDVILPPTPITASAAARSSTPAAPTDEIGLTGERLTRDEAFDLVRRAVEVLTRDAHESVLASEVRASASMILGRDSESLSERNFTRILRDAHDAGMVDLRRRGDDFEVARAAEVDSVADQLERAATAAAPQRSGGGTAAAPPRGMGPRGGGGRSGRGRPGIRPTTPPPELFSVGIVDISPPVEPPERFTEGDHGASTPAATGVPAKKSAERERGRGRKRAEGSKAAATERSNGAQPDSPEAAEAAAKPKARRKRSRKTASSPASGTDAEGGAAD